MAWHRVTHEFKPPTGDINHPSVRYSAVAVAFEGELIVSHGYFYDHKIHHPAWQSNAWAFHFRKHTWRLLHAGESHGAPSARYSATGVLYNDAMWMFGGDDGGHKYSMHNYVFHAWFDQLWRFDLRSYTWLRVNPKDGIVPPKRALHSAVVVGSAMYVYGGLEREDTWKYDFTTSRWTLLLDGPRNRYTSHPGRRHAHAAAPCEDGFFIFGGSRHGKKLKPQVFDDLWRYSASLNTWSQIQPVGLSPPPRSHHSLIALQVEPTRLLLYGGALCIPGCKCYGDTWLFEPQGRWRLLNASNPPIHRYRQSLVLDEADGSLYLFGGESYRPYMYHNAIDRLVLTQLVSGLPKGIDVVEQASLPILPATSSPGSSAAPPKRNVVLPVLAMLLAATFCIFRCVRQSWTRKSHEADYSLAPDD